MTKAILRQALEALELAQGELDPEVLDYTCPKVDAAIAALQAAIDAPEPYDQQALEPCPVCGWKAIVPGEPCLMCERNARMLAPEPEPVAWVYHDGERPELIPGELFGTVFASMKQVPGMKNELPLYPHPPTVREPITQERAEALAHRRCKRYVFIDDVPYQFDAKTLMDFVRDVDGSKTLTFSNYASGDDLR